MSPIHRVEVDKMRFDTVTKDKAESDARADKAEELDNPLSQTGTYEGKKVFKANELNQAGEDKEYFPPKDDHKFKVPQDAQNHVLKPDITLTPGEHPSVELKADKH